MKSPIFTNTPLVLHSCGESNAALANAASSELKNGFVVLSLRSHLTNGSEQATFECAKTDPVRFKWGFGEGLLKDKFAFLEASKVLFLREKTACKTAIFISKKGPLLNAL